MSTSRIATEAAVSTLVCIIVNAINRHGYIAACIPPWRCAAAQGDSWKCNPRRSCWDSHSELSLSELSLSELSLSLSESLTVYTVPRAPPTDNSVRTAQPAATEKSCRRAGRVRRVREVDAHTHAPLQTSGPSRLVILAALPFNIRLSSHLIMPEFSRVSQSPTVPFP